MKYLYNRDTFKKLSINEYSPFQNDIEWGDSLIGRLVNSVVRKSGISINLVRIKPVISELQKEFDNLLDSYKVIEYKDEVKDITLKNLLTKLKESVDNEEDKTTILNLSKTSLDEIKKNKVTELEKPMSDFIEFLESLEDDKTEDEEPVDDKGVKTPDSKITYMFKNLKALKGLIETYDNNETKALIRSYSDDKKLIKTDKYIYNAVFGDTIDKIINDVSINKNKITVDELRKKNPKLANLTSTQKLAGMRLVMESSVVISNHDLVKSYNKLKERMVILLTKSKVKEIEDKLNFIINDYNNPKTKDSVKKLYNEVKRFLVGDKKTMLTTKDSLLENVNITDSEYLLLGEVIAFFSKRAMQFDDIKVYDKLGVMGKHLELFVSSMKHIISDKITEDIDEVGSPEVSTIASKIKDYFYKNIDLKNYVLDKTEADKLKNKFNSLDKKKVDSIVIDGIDPIIDIVKLFNRAYKLHTVPVIPGGRSDGKVSRSVYAEYDAFGSGSGISATNNGPYRNKAIFNQWENAVLDILKESKYRPIFNKNTIINVGGTEIKGAGISLNKMIRDLLDGEKLYKGGSGGSQTSFLSKYFGDEVKVSAKECGYGDDAEKNSELASKINEVNITFSNWRKMKNDESIVSSGLTNTIFQMNNQDKRPLYFYIISSDDNWIYFSYSRTYKFYKDWLNKTTNKKLSFSKTDTLIYNDYSNFTKDNETKSYILRFSKISKQDFNKVINDKKPFNLNSISFEEELMYSEKQTPVEIYVLSNKDDKTIYRAEKTDIKNGFVNPKDKINSTYDKGFTPISKI